MTQALTKPITVKEFLESIPQNSGNRYELHNGAIVEMAQPLGEHEDIVGFLVEKIAVEYVRLNLPYSIPKTALVQSASSESCYSPELLLLNRPALKLEPLWKKYSTVEFAYQVSQFRNNDRIISLTFPELNLTAQQIFDSGL